MVRIAIAGGTGQVAQEVSDVLLATKKHEITILSRKEVPAKSMGGKVAFRTVEYHDTESLVEALRGIHTVLSFIVVHSDLENKAQKNLINAAVAAGVKRFAPSEWAGDQRIPEEAKWDGKGGDIIPCKVLHVSFAKSDLQVLEYTLFQPELFLDYLASPHQTAAHVIPLTTPFDFQNRRAIIVEGADPVFTFTSAGDLAAMVARAVEYEGVWPDIGGISGNKLRVSQILELGENVRGGPFTIDKVKIADLEAGILEISWMPAESHHSFDQEQTAKIIKAAYIGILLSATKGAWDVSDDFNKLFPDFKFVQMDEFLAEHWNGKR